VLLIGDVRTRLGEWDVGAFAGYGWGETDEFRRGGGVTAIWDRDFVVRTASASASTLIDLGNAWYVTPGGYFQWTEMVSDATTDSLNQQIGEETDELSRGALGGELGHESFVGDLIGKFGVRSYLVHDFHLANDFNDRNAVDVAGFATFAGDDIVGGIEVSTTLGRDETDTLTGRAFIAVRF
jgi:hypothetical protein